MKIQIQFNDPYEPLPPGYDPTRPSTWTKPLATVQPVNKPPCPFPMDLLPDVPPSCLLNLPPPFCDGQEMRNFVRNARGELCAEEFYIAHGGRWVLLESTLSMGRSFMNEHGEFQNVWLEFEN